MTIRTLRLSRIELTVADLARAEHFYTGALGFQSIGRDNAEPAMAMLYGAPAIHQVTLRRGEQTLLLQAFYPQGAPYPAGVAAADQAFQHFALPVADIAVAYGRLAPFEAAAISNAGPQRLPASSGGSTAYKFRDPDGHPLELIQMPQPSDGGIDHSAVAVLDVRKSIDFYCDHLGFRVAARQVNTGVEQDRLDGLQNARVEVVALTPELSTPHVELLAYHTPRGRLAVPAAPCDIGATRLVLTVTGLPEPSTLLASGSRAALVRDPDGHFLMLEDSRG